MINKSKIIKDAQKFVSKGQLDKAIAEYDKILKSSPDDSNTHNTVGDLHLKRNDKEKAIDSFKRAAEAFTKSGFTLKAIALYKKVLNINPDQVDILLTMGKLNAERGMLGSANEYYLSAASYFTRQGMRNKALDVYKILCNLNPDNHTLAEKLADLYISEGFENEGVSKFIELTEKKVHLGHFDEAHDYLRRAGNKGSDRFDFIRISALLDLKENRIPEALEKLERAAELDHRDTKVASLLGEAYRRSGRYEDAEKVLRTLASKDPGNKTVATQLMGVSLLSGNFEAAWEQCRDLVETAIARNEFSDAESHLKEFIKHKPDSIEARQMLADVYTKTGREDEVAAQHREIADSYRASGETGKAWNIYRKLLDADPDNRELGDIVAELSEKKDNDRPVPPAVEAPAAPGDEPEQPLDRVAQDAATGLEGFELPDTMDEIEGGVDDIEFPAGDFAGQDEDESDISGTVGDAVEDLSLGGTSDEDEGDFPTFGLGAAPDDVFDRMSATTDEYEEPGGLPEMDLGALDIFGTKEAGPAPSIEEQDQEETAGEISMPHVSSPNVHLTDERQSAREEEPGEGLPDAMDSSPGIEGRGPAHPAGQEGADEDSQLEDLLSELDVYTSYGFMPKAQATLQSLLMSYPDEPRVLARQIELCKATDDYDGLVDTSIRLAGIHEAAGVQDEAAMVLSRALEAVPDDERLRALVEGGTVAQDPAGHEVMDEPVFPKPEEAPKSAAEALIEEKASEDAMLVPGSVQFIEEMAEADFYAQQGLIDEARKIFKRLAAADPDNDELMAKYESLSGRKDAFDATELLLQNAGAPDAGEEPEEPAASSPEAVEGLDKELDDAFREMDFYDKAQVEDAAINQAAMSEEPPEAQQGGPAAAAPPQAEEAEFIDLAAEILDDIGEDIIQPHSRGGSFTDKSLDTVFQEFKKGVEEQLGSEDYETHYNLGIAYKEMGMLDEAVDEFTLASKDKSRTLDCASMLGLCMIEKGEYEKALEQFRKGLETRGRDNEEYMGIRYDIVTAYELAGDLKSAYIELSRVAEEDDGFRDVRERLKNMKKALAASGIDPETVEEDKDDGDKPGLPAKKKSKVSYI